MVLAVPLMLMLINGARGTFAYHRHQIAASRVAGTVAPSSGSNWKIYSAVLASFVFGVLALRVYQLLIAPTPIEQSNVAEEVLPALVKRVQPAVVTITAYDSKGNAIGLGSGFFVSEHGEILTNHHVLEGAASAEAKMSNGSKDPIDAVLADDPDADLTKVVVIEDDKTPFLQLSQEPAEVGERVAVIGSPLGLEHTVSEGIVSAIPEERQEVGETMPATLQITAPISEGSSGSPVIDMKGDVLGVATAYFRKGEDLNFAIPLERILILKQIKPVTLALWSNPHRKPMALDLFGEGLASMQVRDYKQALLSLDLAIRKKPDFALAWWGAGVCLVVLNSTDKGIEALKYASQLDPSLAQPHYSLGIAYVQQGRRGAAYQEYEALKPLDPELAKTLKEQLPK
jgi:Flp pilus assembly protein TadD